MCGALLAAGVAVLYWASAPSVTFHGQVAPLLWAKCAGCHHPGAAAPFSLLTYDDVRRHAQQMVEVTRAGLMPPWLPAAGHGDFVGERRLSTAEIELLAGWVANGMPAGTATTAAAPVFADDWHAGPPDLILDSPVFALPSTGRDVFRNLVLPVQLLTARWVRSVELRPDNPRVVHHARLVLDASTAASRRDGADGAPGFPGMAWGEDPDGQLLLWAPGLPADAGQADRAWRLPAHTHLVLHAHLQPTGKPERVRFRIGLRWADGPPAQVPVLLRVGSRTLDIPAGASAHTVTDEWTLTHAVAVQAIFPHAHSLCQSVTVTATAPNGARTPLLHIPRFDENWHDLYRYRQPVPLLAGTRLTTTLVYDNSAANLRNRHQPPQRVVYGSSVTDEMGDVYLQVVPVHADQRAALLEEVRNRELRSQLQGYRLALTVHPNQRWNQEALALVWQGLGQPQNAIPIWEQRVADDPTAFARVSLGAAMLANGQPQRAEPWFRQALVLDADHALAWNGLGQALAAQRQYTDALPALRRATELAPGLVEAYLRWIECLIATQRWTEADQVCAQAAQQCPEMPGVYLKWAEVAAHQRDWATSLRHCTQARQWAPHTHPPKVLLVVFCCAHGATDEGRRLLLEARAEEPFHPVAAQMLGQLACARHDWPTARTFLDEAAVLPLPANWPASHQRRFLHLLHTQRHQLGQQLHDADLIRDALARMSPAGDTPPHEGP
jgi:tetratricopeptide (TPR) repeat protein